MNKQVMQFSVEIKDGVVTKIGKSAVHIPEVQYTGKKTKWFDDSKLIKR